MHIEKLFPTSIAMTDLPEHIADEVEQYYIPYLPDSNPSLTDNVHTDFFSKNKSYDIHSHLKFAIEELLVKYLREENFGLDTLEVSDYWLQDYPAGGNHSKHTHPGFFISGVYYIRSNDPNNSISFYNPNAVHEHLFNEQINMIECTRGRLILFPSYLPHSVNSTSSNSERTVIAFNFR